MVPNPIFKENHLLKALSYDRLMFLKTYAVTFVLIMFILSEVSGTVILMTSFLAGVSGAIVSCAENPEKIKEERRKKYFFMILYLVGDNFQRAKNGQKKLKNTLLSEKLKLC